MTESKLVAEPKTEAVVKVDELPVVARLVVEIRSDGTHTIARGAIEDRLRGETVSLEAEGTTPAALAISLMGSLQKLPLFNPLHAARLVAKQVLNAILLPKKR